MLYHFVKYDVIYDIILNWISYMTWHTNLYDILYYITWHSILRSRYDVIVTNPSWYPLNPWYRMVYSRFFYDIIVTNPSWYPPNPWRSMLRLSFFLLHRRFWRWHHRFWRWHHRFWRWHSILHTMQCHDQYHRYLIPCLCWGSARTPRSPWCWPVDCPAAPEPPASLSVGLFGSTTVAIFIDMSYLVSAGERPNTTDTLVLASRLPCCTRATCLIVSRPVWQYNSVYSLMFQVRP